MAGVIAIYYTKIYPQKNVSSENLNVHRKTGHYSSRDTFSYLTGQSFRINFLVSSRKNCSTLGNVSFVCYFDLCSYIQGQLATCSSAENSRIEFSIIISHVYTACLPSYVQQIRGGPRPEGSCRCLPVSFTGEF